MHPWRSRLASIYYKCIKALTAFSYAFLTCQFFLYILMRNCNGNQGLFPLADVFVAHKFYCDGQCSSSSSSFTFLRICQAVRLGERKEEDNTSLQETGFDGKNKTPASYSAILFAHLLNGTNKNKRKVCGLVCK